MTDESKVFRNDKKTFKKTTKVERGCEQFSRKRVSLVNCTHFIQTVKASSQKIDANEHDFPETQNVFHFVKVCDWS
jgi:hypothetical protein